MDPWTVSAEERAKHDSQFSTLTMGTHITGEQARGFFMQSGLPQMVLGQIWGLADVTADGKMDRKEFSIAMTLIKRKLTGHQIPSVLPHSMLREPTMSMTPGNVNTLPHGMTVGAGGFPVGMTAGPSGFAAMSSATLPARLQPSATQPLSVPGSPARSADGLTDWAVPQANRLRYNQMFNKEDRKRTGYLTGLDARQLLISTGLPHNLLAQIWSLADVDGDGRLTSEEFSLAMFLAEMAKLGQPLPVTLPPNFIPPSMRSRSRSNSGILPAANMLAADARPTDSFGDLIPGGFGSSAKESQPVEEIAPIMNLTLEDKRRENFAKGNAELERRRAELRDQQRKEEEARLAKEKAEQEKREAIRREQERKRLAEQERMMERQRQLEAEREEQRRKALEARESARKEMERQRQQEWERQRRQTLIAEKKRHEEAVQMLESQVNNLKYEIETMDNKKKELIARIAEGKENVIRNTGYIDDMRSTRDSLISSLSANESAKNEQERMYQKLCNDFSHVTQLLQTRQSQNPVSESFKQQQNLHSSKSQQVDKLRQQLAEINSSKSNVMPDSDTLNRLKDSVSQLQSSQSQVRSRLQLKKSEWESEKRRRADEKIRADKEQQMKEEAEKQKQIEEEKKKKEEDKWSVFKDLDFSAPAATTATTAPDINSSQSNSAWGFCSSADWGTSEKVTTDLWSGQSTANNTTPDSVWGSTTSQSTASSDLFADSSWGKPSSSGGWGKASAATDPSKKTTGLLPPPKLLQKKETVFGGPSVEVKTSPAVTAAPVAPSKTSVPAAVTSQPKTRKVEIYEVQYDFAARNEDELDLVMEEKVKVYPDEQGSAEPGWLSGWKGDKAGIFPANYVTKQRDVYEPVAANTPSKVTAVTAPPAAMTRSESAFDEVRSSPTPETGSPAPAGLTCVAVYPWRAKKDNHLSFNEGDSIKVLMQQDLWWQGSLPSGEQGWFPSSYVKVADSSQPSSDNQSAVAPGAITGNSRLYDIVPSEPSADQSAASRLYDQVPGDAGEQQVAPQTGERYLAMHDYQSDVEGDLVFTAGEFVLVTSKEGGEWWTGSIGSRSGIFPANYVGLSSEQTKPTSPVATPSTAVSVPVSAPVSAPAAAGSQLKEIGKVIAAYDATGPEQLSLKLNQLIHVKKKSPSGWWEGELVAKGQKKQIGWFPKDYIKLLPSSGGSKTSRPSTPASFEMEPSRSKQPTPVPPATPQQVKVMASYPYTAQNDDELTFAQSDIITIVNKDDPDWWMGELGGVSGVFPANYVQPYTEPS